MRSSLEGEVPVWQFLGKHWTQRGFLGKSGLSPPEPSMSVSCKRMGVPAFVYQFTVTRSWTSVLLLGGLSLMGLHEVSLWP